jgi:hypothetical protein
MNRIAAFLLLCFLWQTAHAAEVLFVCGTQQDYFHAVDEDYTKLVPTTEDHETITTEDITIIGGEDRSAYRKGTKPIVKHCHNYVVTFDAYWINANLDGLDGGDSWVTIEIKNQKGTVLPRTVIGKCDNNRPGSSGCKDKWAVEIRLDDRYLGITRLNEEALPLP